MSEIKATHESKHKLFHVNVMRIIPYIAENPRQSSTLMKFSSNLIIFQQDATYSVGKLLNSIHDARTHICEFRVICATFCKRELTKANFQWLRFYYSVYYHISYLILRYLLHGVESFLRR